MAGRSETLSSKEGSSDRLYAGLASIAVVAVQVSIAEELFPLHAPGSEPTRASPMRAEGGPMNNIDLNKGNRLIILDPLWRRRGRTPCQQ